MITSIGTAHFSSAWQAVSGLVKRGYITKLSQTQLCLTPEGQQCVQLLKSRETTPSIETSLQRLEITNQLPNTTTRVNIANLPRIDPIRTLNAGARISKPLSGSTRISVFSDEPSSVPAMRTRDFVQQTSSSTYVDTQPPVATMRYGPIHKVILIIDSREMQFQSQGKKEASLKLILDELGVCCEMRGMAVGDMTWIAQMSDGKEFVLDYIVERKAVEDLCSSILDGRYNEQKHRLKKSKVKNVIYLLEGSTKGLSFKRNHYKSVFSEQTLRKALCSTQTKYNFHIETTADLDGTAEYLARVHRLVSRKYPRGSFLNSTPERLFSRFNESMSKSSSLTLRDCFAKQLLQIQGCGPEKVFSVMELFPTPRALLRAVSTRPRSELESIIAKLKYGGANRSIGPAVAKRICSYYCN
jgi:ERCC4-type nuclease